MLREQLAKNEKFTITCTFLKYAQRVLVEGDEGTLSNFLLLKKMHVSRHLWFYDW